MPTRMHAAATLLALAGPLLASALQSPLVVRQHPRLAVVSTARMAVPPDADAERSARIDKLEECLADFDAVRDDPKMFNELLQQLTDLKKEGLSPGSSKWAAVVVEAEQRANTFRWAFKQQAEQRGSAFIRDRDRAEREASSGLDPGSREWILAMEKASAETSQAYRMAEMQMAAAREAASKKRAALLDALFADSSSGQAPAPQATDAALNLLFNSGYDAEGGDVSQLTNADVKRMQGVIASTSAAIKRDTKDVALLLRRAALHVALGEPALARQDYERVLEIDPSNPEAKKYVDLASYGAAFDAYEILGVERDASAEVISAAFRRLAKQWHPDRWISGTEAEQLEAETRFKQLNLAQGVLMDEAKRRKYDAGTASVADLMVGWWEKMTKQWGSPSKASKMAAPPLTPNNIKATEVLTVKLTGCGSGVGVGLNKQNIVDMLVPGKPASKQLQIGDRVLEFDGQSMVKRRPGGGMEQRLLKEVVQPGETHIVKLERRRLPAAPVRPGLPPAGR